MSLSVQFPEARPIREAGRAETRAATAMGVKIQNLIATGLIKHDACNRSEYDEMRKRNRRTRETRARKFTCTADGERVAADENPGLYTAMPSPVDVAGLEVLNLWLVALV